MSLPPAAEPVTAESATGKPRPLPVSKPTVKLAPRPKKPSENPAIQMAKIVGGGVAGIVIGLFIVRAMGIDLFNTRPPAPENADGGVAAAPADPPGEKTERTPQPNGDSTNEHGGDESNRHSAKFPGAQSSKTPESTEPQFRVAVTPGFGGSSEDSYDSSKPESPSPAEPPGGDPFRRLPARAAISTAEEVYDLGPVIGREAEKWRVSLDTSLANLGGQREFFLPAEETTDPQRVGWRIGLRPLGEARSGDAEAVLARFFVEDDRLKFEWALDPAYAPLRPQLLNCVAFFSDGEHDRELILRQPVKMDAVTLDPSQKVIHVPLEAPGLPAPENLVFYVDDLEQFPPGIQVDPVPGRLQAGERLRVQVSSGVPDLSAEIDLRFQHQGETPGILIRAWYRTGGRREELTVEHVQSERVMLQRKVALDQAELKEAKAAVPQIEDAIRELTSRRPANQTESVLLRKQAATLQAQGKKAVTTIGRLEKSIPSMLAAIQQIGHVEGLGNQLHNKARFHGRLCAAADQREITLVELGRSANP